MRERFAIRNSANVRRRVVDYNKQITFIDRSEMPLPQFTEPEPRHISFAFWDRKLGPFLSQDGVLNIAALSIAELQVCLELGDVLSLPSSNQDTLYPTFQFGPRGERLPGLREIVVALHVGTRDQWDIALWLVTIRKHYDGRSAADLLWTGQIVEVLAAARADGELWNSEGPQ
jgi:hypothetical protein